VTLHDTIGTAIRFNRSPREVVLGALSLALGVGFLSAAFSVVDAVLLRPLPYDSPDHLVRIWDITGPPGVEVLSTRDFSTLRSATSLAGVAGYFGVNHTVTATTGVRRAVPGQQVSPELFELLGATPLAGRVFSRADGQFGRPLVMVISSRLASLLRLEPEDTVILNELPHTVVGVMPPEFWFPDRRAEYWIPLVQVPAKYLGAGSTDQQVRSIARLADRVSLESAAAEVNAVLGDRRRQSALRMQRFRDYLMGPARLPLTVLQLGSGLLLALTCLNAAWLLRVRAVQRRRALAIMASLGAARRDLIGTCVVEAVIITLVVVPAALGIAKLLLALGGRLENGILTHFGVPSITGQVTAVTAIAAVIASAAAFVPAVITQLRTSPGADLLRAGRSGPGHGRRLYIEMIFQASIVFAIAVQAVTLVLVMQKLVSVNVGLRESRIIGLHIRPGGPDNAVSAVVALQYQEMVDQLERTGMPSAAANIAPLTGVEHLTSTRTPERSVREFTMVRVRAVSPSYFRLLGLDVTAGRLPSGDRHEAGVVVIDGTFASRLLGRAGGTGQRILLGGSEWEVIGIIRPVRNASLFEEPQPTVYVQYRDVSRLSPQTAMALTSEVVLMAIEDGGASTALQRLRAAARDLLPGATVGKNWRFRDLVWLASGERPLMTAGVTVFASIAIMLLGLGFSGMLMFLVRTKQRDIAVRICLGATRGRVIAEVVAPMAAVAATAVIVGAGLSYALEATLLSLAYAPTPTIQADAWMVGAVSTAAFAVVVAFAVGYPALKAAQTDPIAALKQEA